MIGFKAWFFWPWIVFFVSCGGVAPDIIELRWRLNVEFKPREVGALKDDATLGRETLSVFVNPGDDDGLADLDSMYLIHRGEDLFWALDSTQWSSINSSSIFWVGSNEFSSGYMRRLPRGTYIVELYDKAGESDRRNFEVNSESTQSFASLVTVPPVGDQLLFLLPDDVSTYAIVGYNVNDGVLFTDANYQSIISLRELRIRNDELDKVILSFRFPDSNVTARIGPYLVPRLGRTNLLIDREDEAQDAQGAQSSVPSTVDEGPIDTYIPAPEEVEALQEFAPAPAVSSPSEEAPVTEAPVTEAPVTEAPVTEAPVAEVGP